MQCIDFGFKISFFPADKCFHFGLDSICDCKICAWKSIRDEAPGQEEVTDDKSEKHPRDILNILLHSAMECN